MPYIPALDHGTVTSVSLRLDSANGPQEITKAKDRLMRIDLALEMLRKDEEEDRERAKAYEAGKVRHGDRVCTCALEPNS